MIKAYTNIVFTEKQLEDIPKLYDALILNDVWAFVEDKIPAIERQYIWDNILIMAEEITKYNNSILGVLKAISEDYSEMNLDASAIQEKFKDPETLPMVKQLLNGLVGQLG
jgi:hypothetical protein